MKMIALERGKRCWIIEDANQNIIKRYKYNWFAKYFHPFFLEYSVLKTSSLKIWVASGSNSSKKHAETSHKALSPQKVKFYEANAFKVGWRK
ncbi:unnamed protein product [Blepharisma stoltei]|uniref:Uncharacterized protein n=1 Tax=Blepharisma stoltei TaxID=1481888 RepID=A0AAU9JMW9_9CILI|nr:unnamed protein product [Blepharisma stoltei]